MTKEDWLDLTVLERKKYNCLSEVMDLSRQMGEAMDRNDQVSTRMLVAMRQDPIRQLTEVEHSGKLRLTVLAPEDRETVAALRKGAGPQDDGQRIFQEHAGKTRRLLEQIVELDRRVSLRMAGENSFYTK